MMKNNNVYLFHFTHMFHALYFILFDQSCFEYKQFDNMHKSLLIIIIIVIIGIYIYIKQL